MMVRLELNVRFYDEYLNDYRHETHELPVEETALLLVDCDGVYTPGSEAYALVEERIAPALAAARRAGVEVIYVHDDFTLASHPRNRRSELFGERLVGRPNRTYGVPPAVRKVTRQPEYMPSIAPLYHEPDFPKRSLSAFRDVAVDHYLRLCGIETVFVAGFNLPGSVYQTCVGALEHNYRVVLLRDAVATPEFDDTADEAHPEGGWMRHTFLRSVETMVGYTALTGDMVDACEDVAAFLEKDAAAWPFTRLGRFMRERT
jgi:nicotinamidase-related amidase